eukprot:TCALIF_02067-PA protein Name:"Similar to tag-325 WW domain-containing protein tag-325 (Caenorhabditis elegans)" AED:0.00 eAED:0.00 QI:67/0.83/0.42/1/1/0.85/7/0/693
MNPSWSGSTSRLPLVRRRRSTFGKFKNDTQITSDWNSFDDEDEITTPEEDNRRRSRLNRSLDNILEALNNINLFETAHTATPKNKTMPQKKKLPPPVAPLELTMDPQPTDDQHDDSDIGHDVVLRQKSNAYSGSEGTNRATSSSRSLDLPPNVKSPTSKFLGVLNTEWDTYQDKRNGRVFFHHSYSGNSQWKPPRQSSIPVIPRNKQSVFTYDDSQVSEANETTEDELKSPIKKNNSYVRDSIRKSDQLDIEVPTGYVQIYEKSSGYISYFDPMSEITWQTSLDESNTLYFFNESGKSVWNLPTIHTSMIDSNFSTPPRLNIIRAGWLDYKGSYGQTPSSKKPKWCKYFAALVDAHLLLFEDKSSYEQIWIPTITGELLKSGNTGSGNSAKNDKRTRDEIPHVSVDLSHCCLSWGKIHKTNFLLKLQSDIDKNSSNTKLRFNKSDEADCWFQDLSHSVKQTVRNTGTPHLTRKKSTREHPASISVPASPLFSSRGGATHRQSIQHLSSSTVKETKGSSLSLKASFRGTREKIGEIWNRSNKVSPAQTDSTIVPDSDSSCPKPGNVDPPKTFKLKREGSFLQSFRKPKAMDDGVKLRVKKTQLERTPSKQKKINYLTAFIGNSRDSKRQSRESLVERGIIKPASVFGNSLSKMKPDPATGLPEFLVRATQRIETFADTVGIYRVNGDAAIVQKI